LELGGLSLGRILNLWGKYIGNKINKQLKEEIYQDEKNIRERIKLHKQIEYEKTIDVLMQSEHLFDNKDLEYFKDIIDITLDGKPKEKSNEDKHLSKKQLMRNIQNRLKNKKLIYDDHEFIREQIENYANKKMYNIEYTLNDYKKEQCQAYEMKNQLNLERTY